MFVIPPPHTHTSPIPSFLAVLGCQAILVSNRNKSFRRGSVGQPLSSTKSSRIRSQRPLSLQPAGLGEIYCEERKKVVISWHFHDETWPKLCWLGGLEAHKECGCVWPSPSQSHHHSPLTHTPPPPLPDHFPFCRPRGAHPYPSRWAAFSPNERRPRQSSSDFPPWPLNTLASHWHSSWSQSAGMSSVRNRHRRSSNRQDVFCI